MSSCWELCTGASQQFARKTSHDKTFIPKVISSHWTSEMFHDGSQRKAKVCRLMNSYKGQESWTPILKYSAFNQQVCISYARRRSRNIQLLRPSETSREQLNLHLSTQIGSTEKPVYLFPLHLSDKDLLAVILTFLWLLTHCRLTYNKIK